MAVIGRHRSKNKDVLNEAFTGFSCVLLSGYLNFTKNNI